MRTEAVEDYLKTIYLVETERGEVTTLELAARMEISAPSVTGMLKKLAELKLVKHEPYHGVVLTAAGRKIALEVIRHHRLLELYLAEALGYSWDKVHAEAEKLEHHISEEFEDKIAALLGNPVTDPHGDPIPDAKGKIQKSNFIKLSETKVKGNYKVMGVTDHSPTFLKYLEKHELIIGAGISIKTIEDFDNSIILVCQKKEVSISPKAAECIIVQTI